LRRPWWAWWATLLVSACSGGDEAGSLEETGDGGDASGTLRSFVEMLLQGGGRHVEPRRLHWIRAGVAGIDLREGKWCAALQAV
jgi:hypothetical protein